MGKNGIFIGYNKENGEIFATTSRKALASFLGVHRNTIGRQLETVSRHENEKYIIWLDIAIVKQRRTGRRF